MNFIPRLQVRFHDGGVQLFHFFLCFLDYLLTVDSIEDLAWLYQIGIRHLLALDYPVSFQQFLLPTRVER